MAKALSYCRIRKRKLSNFCRFWQISSLQTRCCQDGSLPDFGSSVLSDISQIEPDLDVGDKLSNPLELQRNIQSRKLQNISIQKLAIKYNRMIKILKEKQDLDYRRKTLSMTIQNMMKDRKEEEEIMRVKETARGLRDQYDTAVKSLQDIQHEVDLLAFGLPNTLSQETPVDNEVILETSGSPEMLKGRDMISHIVLAEKTGLIKFSSVGNRAFYLVGELAEVQQNLLSYFSTMAAEQGFILMTAPDFCKDFVTEGCGIQRDLIYKLQQPPVDKGVQYSVLGASEASFATYLTKMNITKKALPLQLVSIGPSYNSGCDPEYPGLFSATQTSKTNLLGVYCTLLECYDKFKELQQLLLQVYRNFNVPIRLVLVPACKLKLSEEIRAELQIWTPSLQDYLPAASISVFGDFISRRLAIRPVGNKEFEATRLQMVYAEVLDTTKLIAILVEYGSLDRDTGTYQMMKLNFLNQADSKQKNF